MKKTTFLIAIVSVILLPGASYAMTLSDVLNQYYIETSTPKVLGASTNDGGKTTTSLSKPKLSAEASLNIIKGLRYSEGSAAVVSTQLKKGMRNDEVKKLQLVLIAKGYLDADPTGFYGSQTTKAVKEFQMKNGIIHTGELVGPSTRAAIEAEVLASTPDIKQ
jgi:peptidoglycan hydrolase-like protein with peptidoglycan-binding domain